ncbi:hypothetical protein C8P68_101138 [Mucilaginibacter yixingensis]|uniref:Uncharacterized protein n=1 Tax=Mucilaginibacter yixingensis TaxID=1295612 RepID=A0A2T5JES1_9SPHI|nr:hypothetical protein [Mucilaginibacter yixingensis]PTR00909.1 hypothetical protein C8P68_101138 [Mucilaginibacter yixingensis]
MPNVYKIGNSHNSINLQADIHTVGAAASKASITSLDDDSDAGVAVARSVDATGDIESQPIGDYRSLKGKLLNVWTEIAAADGGASGGQG